MYMWGSLLTSNRTALTQLTYMNRKYSTKFCFGILMEIFLIKCQIYFFLLPFIICLCVRVCVFEFELILFAYHFYGGAVFDFNIVVVVVVFACTFIHLTDSCVQIKMATFIFCISLVFFDLLLLLLVLYKCWFSCCCSIWVVVVVGGFSLIIF